MTSLDNVEYFDPNQFSYNVVREDSILDPKSYIDIVDGSNLMDKAAIDQNKKETSYYGAYLNVMPLKEFYEKLMERGALVASSLKERAVTEKSSDIANEQIAKVNACLERLRINIEFCNFALTEHPKREFLNQLHAFFIKYNHYRLLNELIMKPEFTSEKFAEMVKSFKIEMQALNEQAKKINFPLSQYWIRHHFYFFGNDSCAKYITSFLDNKSKLSNSQVAFINKLIQINNTEDLEPTFRALGRGIRIEDRDNKIFFLGYGGPMDLSLIKAILEAKKELQFTQRLFEIHERHYSGRTPTTPTAPVFPEAPPAPFPKLHLI